MTSGSGSSSRSRRDATGRDTTWVVADFAPISSLNSSALDPEAFRRTVKAVLVVEAVLSLGLEDLFVLRERS